VLWGCCHPQINYLLITNVTTAFAVPVEAPSVIISIACPSLMSLLAVGSDESTSPAAEPELAIVIPPLVIAVPPISKLIPASSPDIAPYKAVKILIIFPLSGTATNVEDAVLTSAIVDVIK